MIWGSAIETAYMAYAPDEPVALKVNTKTYVELLLFIDAVNTKAGWGPLRPLTWNAARVIRDDNVEVGWGRFDWEQVGWHITFRLWTTDIEVNVG